MIDTCGPKVATEFGDQLEVAFAVLVPGRRREEVARVGQSVAADRPEIRQAKRRTAIFADVSARRAIEQLDAEAQPSRHDRDLLRLDLEQTKLGCKPKTSLLRHDQQLAVCIVEEAVLHRTVRHEEMNTAAGLRNRIAITGQRSEAIDEIGCVLRD